MSGPQQFACAIILDVNDRFLLQQRDHKPEIRHPGMIGLFGGHVEPGETPLQCVAREIFEEIGYHAPLQAFAHLAKYTGLEASGTYEAEVYVVDGARISDLTITEGALLVVAPEDVFGLFDKLTPSAAFALEIFLGRQEAQ